MISHQHCAKSWVHSICPKIVSADSRDGLNWLHLVCPETETASTDYIWSVQRQPWLTTSHLSRDRDCPDWLHLVRDRDSLESIHLVCPETRTALTDYILSVQRQPRLTTSGLCRDSLISFPDHSFPKGTPAPEDLLQPALTETMPTGQLQPQSSCSGSHCHSSSLCRETFPWRPALTPKPHPFLSSRDCRKSVILRPAG